MSRIREFLSDRRGGMVEKIAVMAGAIALASMSGAHLLDVASRDENSKLYALFHKTPGVDYTATATIRNKAGQTVLDPCGTRAR